jgi:hypothetical protein
LPATRNNVIVQQLLQIPPVKPGVRLGVWDIPPFIGLKGEGEHSALPEKSAALPKEQMLKLYNSSAV